MVPTLICGTASFGMDLTEFQDADSVKDLLTSLPELHVQRLDSGARYPPLDPGRSEQLIGETKEQSSAFSVDTKVYTDTKTDGSGDLTPAAISKSAIASLERLQRPEGVNVLYAHRADPKTPLEDQIQGFNEQITQGRCKAWGVSNTPPDVLEKILNICEQKGWQKPSCYQGEYSLISRGVETRLLPLLRAHGMKFNAFRGLAAGFLTGNSVNNQTAGTRFADDNPVGKAMKQFFGAEDLTEAMKNFDKEVRANGLTPIEVAARWLSHHSALRDDDGIVLGSSKKRQIIEVVSFIQKGPLPPAFLELAEGLWGKVKATRGNII